MWNNESVEEARRSLLTYYNSLQSGQGTRLIGFVAGLFTLLELTQVSETGMLRTVFPNFKIIDLPIVDWDWFRFIILAIGTLIIVFFIMGAIFRFAVFGHYFSAISYMDKQDFEKGLQEVGGKDKDKQDKITSSLGPIHLITIAAAIKMLDRKRKVYGVFPISYFMTGLDRVNYKSQETFGRICQFIISVIITSLILALIW